MIRIALHTALSKGYNGRDIRGGVERWLWRSPPDRIVVVDPAREMGELLVHEVEKSVACLPPPARPATWPASRASCRGPWP
jgi:hypothetical protein